MPSVLFVCTANQFRSPLAAALFSREVQARQAAGTWQVASAGTWARKDQPVPDFAVRIAQSLGLNGLENHQSRQVDREMLSRIDLCIVMEAGHKEALGVEFPHLRGRLFLLSEVVQNIPYDIPDPALPDIDPYEVARELQTLIRQGAARLIALAGSLARRN